MSKTNGKPAGRPPYNTSRPATLEPGDEVIGAFTRERLVAMNERFCAAMGRAFASGREDPASAAHAVNVPQKSLIELLAYPWRELSPPALDRSPPRSIAASIERHPDRSPP